MYWPKCLAYCHPFSLYSCAFYFIVSPLTKENTCRLLWSLLGAVCCMPLMWTTLGKSVENSHQWEDFLLSIIASVCKCAKQKVAWTLYIMSTASKEREGYVMHIVMEDAKIIGFCTIKYD